MRLQAQYTELLLEIELKILLGKTGARLNLKIKLISLHTGPDIILLKIYILLFCLCVGTQHKIFQNLAIYLLLLSSPFQIITKRKFTKLPVSQYNNFEFK
jgi:hypothetical protein